MGAIDLPDVKAKLWHGLRADLSSIVPWFADNDLLLCPTCCRALPYDQFSIEHILPQQAIALDPAAVREAIPKNVRSGLTLLCRQPLVWKGRNIPGSGCNGWKGKHYDPFLRELLRPGHVIDRINSRGHVGLVIACYLALFREYGYQIALLPSGLLLRNQFFHPNSLLSELPFNCQMFLAGDQQAVFDETTAPYWSVPFKFTMDRGEALVVLRNMALRLPLSRDPTVPIARVLRYAPARYKLRPDLVTAFD